MYINRGPGGTRERRGQRAKSRAGRVHSELERARRNENPVDEELERLKDSPTGRVTSLEATFPARAKSGFWKDSNHSRVSFGEVSVKKSPVGPLSFCSTPTNEISRNRRELKVSSRKAKERAERAKAKREGRNERQRPCTGQFCIPPHALFREPWP